MTLTGTKPLVEEEHSEERREMAVIKEAQRRHRRRLFRTAFVSLSVIVVATAGAMFAEHGGGGGTPSHPADSASNRSSVPYLTSLSAHPSFVLLPTWLPPGFSASGGNYVKPVGGLKVGNKVGVSVETVRAGHTNPQPDPVPFTLRYYGYHNPESKNIWLIATRYGYGPRGRLQKLGGRHVALESRFVPGYFGGNTNSSAAWVEHGLFISVQAQGITKAQLARFVAGLKEHPAPNGS